MSFPPFKLGCFGFVAGCVLLGGGATRAQSRNARSAQLRVRVVVVPSIRAPLPRKDQHQGSLPDSSISFDLAPREPAVQSARDILVADPATHENRRAQLQTITVVAE